MVPDREVEDNLYNVEAHYLATYVAQSTNKLHFQRALLLVLPSYH